MRVLSLAMCAFALLAGCSSGNDTANASPTTASDVTLTTAQQQHITLYDVEPSTWHKTIDTTGVVDFDQDHSTSVLAPFSGPVIRALVAPGDQVKKGQALALVASSDFAADLSAYRKAVDTANTARRVADNDADMLAHRAIAQREAQQAQTDAANAEADRDAALQTLRSLNASPQVIAAARAGTPVASVEAAIRAPIAGTVVEKNITPGQLLQAGTTPCFTIADLSRVWVMARLFGDDGDAVHVGDSAQVMPDNGTQTWSGRVTNVSAQVDPDTRAVTARIALANLDGVLKKQMYARVHIVSQQSRTGLLIPAGAVLRDDDNLPFVYVAEPGGSYARRHVTLGDHDGDRVVVASGLKGGERLVTEGGIFVRFIESQ